MGDADWRESRTKGSVVGVAEHKTRSRPGAWRQGQVLQYGQEAQQQAAGAGGRTG